MTSIDRRRYAELYGPTVGDKVRLGDTDLWISPTEDRCSPSGPGDETVFGGGKVVRESMGQATFSTVDLVITNAVVLDHCVGHMAHDHLSLTRLARRRFGQNAPS